MNNPIRQHIVPQSYLKRFSFNEKSSFYVYMQSRNNKTINKVNIENVAVVKNFYTLDKVEDNYAWEKFYANSVEPIMSRTLSEIVRRSYLNVYCSQAKILSDSLKTYLSFAFIYQMLRDQHARDFMNKVIQETVGPALNEAKNKFMHKGNEELDKYLETFEVGDHILKLAMMDSSTNFDRIQSYSRILLHRSWLLFKIDGNNEFITSDHPLQVVNRNSLEAIPFTNGIAQETTCIYFPITPKLLLGLYPKGMYFGRIDKLGDKLVNIDSLGDRKFIHFVNQLQSLYCYKQYYSKSKWILSTL